MQWIPPINPRQYNLEKLLAARGVDISWLNDANLEPHGRPNVARNSITEATKIVPFHFRDAMVTNPRVHAWLRELVAQADADQQDRNSPVAFVTHGRSMLLLGPTGTGKTYEAYGVIRDLAITGVAARWMTTTAADMYAALRPRHGIDSEAEFARYRNASVLLVDDLGAERKATEFTEEINFRLVNHRYERHLPTLFTSNVLPKELAHRLGDRVTSRLTQMCERVVLDGPDRRKEIAA